MPTDHNIRHRYWETKNLWNRRRESTCTSHQRIGHYQAAMKDNNFSWFFFQRGEVPAISGYSPKRHRECVDLVIMKKKATYGLKAQRKLGIVNTEFNNNNKIIAQSISTHSRKLGTIAKEKFATKGSASIDQIITNRCYIDHNHSQKKSFALISVDLEGCYDIILHLAAALALFSIGIPHARIHSMFESIQKMIHRIRTAFGDSDIMYRGEDIGDWVNKPQGVLQGNTAGSDIWSALSSVKFKLLHSRGFAENIVTAVSKQVLTLVGFVYVDDCGLIQSVNNPINVLAYMQSLINSWGSLMEVTGGAVRADKSWWYMIDYVWKRGKRVASDPQLNIDLVATNTNGESVTLSHLRSDEAAEMVGVWLAPSGDNNKIIKVLKTAAVKWGGESKLIKAGGLDCPTLQHFCQIKISFTSMYPL